MISHQTNNNNSVLYIFGMFISCFTHFSWSFGATKYSQKQMEKYVLGGGFKIFFIVNPILGKIPIVTHIFQMG